jgi:hypothetical protein
MQEAHHYLDSKPLLEACSVALLMRQLNQVTNFSVKIKHWEEEGVFSVKLSNKLQI